MGLIVNGGVDYSHLVQLNKDLLQNYEERKTWLANIAERDDDNTLQNNEYKSLHQIGQRKQAILTEIAHCIQLIDEAT